MKHNKKEVLYIQTKINKKYLPPLLACPPLSSPPPPQSLPRFLLSIFVCQSLNLSAFDRCALFIYSFFSSPPLPFVFCFCWSLFSCHVYNFFHKKTTAWIYLLVTYMMQHCNFRSVASQYKCFVFFTLEENTQLHHVFSRHITTLSFVLRPLLSLSSVIGWWIS